MLNIFDGALNLADGDGAVLALVRSESMLGPFAAVVPGLNWPPEERRISSRFSLPPLEPSLIEWNPRPDWRALASPQWVPAALAMPEPPSTAAMRAVAELANALGSAEDASRLEKVSVRLAGVGGGLTPEGDDALVGAMHATWATRDEPTARRLCALIATTAAPRTTLLSAAWLRAAAVGDAAMPWHVLIRELAASFGERSAGLDAAWQGVLAMGASSGAAALSGFVRTLARFRG